MNRRHWTKQFGRQNFMTNFVQADHFIKNDLIIVVDVKVREGFTIKVGISFRVGCSRSPTLQSTLFQETFTVFSTLRMTWAANTSIK